jgi:hypothetical protein
MQTIFHVIVSHSNVIQNYDAVSSSVLIGSGRGRSPLSFCILTFVQPLFKLVSQLVPASLSCRTVPITVLKFFDGFLTLVRLYHTELGVTSCCFFLVHTTSVSAHINTATVVQLLIFQGRNSDTVTKCVCT